MDNNTNRNTNRNNSKNDRDNKNQKKNQIIGIVVALVAAFLFTTLSSYIVDSMTTKEISYNQFIALLENNNVESVVFNNNKIEITPKDNNGNIIKVKYWTTELNDPELIQELKEKYNFRVKLYLHPYERMLLHEYKITVPYLNQLIEAHIDIDDSAGRSIDKLYECKIGVSLFSTIIADRW